jgi:hypothetical protein
MNLKSVVAIAALKAAYKRLGISASVTSDLSDSAIKTLGISYKTKLLPILMAIEVGYFITEIDIEGNAFVQDGTGVEDGLIYAFLKGLSDDPSMVDQAVFAFNKVINEAPSVTHTEVFDFYKNIANEAANVAEAHSLSLGKAIPDSPTAVDVYTYAATKALTEAPSMTDSFDYTAGKEFTESPSLVDAIVTAFFSSQTETPNFTDAAVFDRNKVLTESVNATDDVDGAASTNDDQEMQFVKNTSEAPSVSDAIAIVAAFTRSFTESPSVADTDTIETGKNVTENPSISETNNYNFDKLLGEDPTMVDVFAMQVTLNPFSEAPSVADTFNAVPNKVKTEAPSLTDAGSLRSQGYCDFTFFEEDYVGASRTF